MSTSSAALNTWVQQQLSSSGVTLQPLYGDASRRRYFRVQTGGKSCIAVDASVEVTDIPAFEAIDKALAAQYLPVPHILGVDLMHGYLLLSDLGDTSLLQVLNRKNVHSYYQKAFDHLICMQEIESIPDFHLPKYDAALITREWNIFTDWYLQNYKHIHLPSVQNILDDVLALLLQTFAEQPQVFVHRDYHSRNLMVLDDKRLGIIDFQGARLGPITYDLVSLLRDCYIAWPKKQVRNWVLHMQPILWQQVAQEPVSPEAFMRWFDLTGLQRHLKVLGLFARKALAEKNERYVADLPRVMHYVKQTCKHYPELKALAKLLRGKL